MELHSSIIGMKSRGLEGLPCPRSALASADGPLRTAGPSHLRASLWGWLQGRGRTLHSAGRDHCPSTDRTSLTTAGPVSKPRGYSRSADTAEPLTPPAVQATPTQGDTGASSLHVHSGLPAPNAGPMHTAREHPCLFRKTQPPSILISVVCERIKPTRT